MNQKKKNNPLHVGIPTHFLELYLEKLVISIGKK